ncbi:MAG: hypothetical protein JSV03_06485 [Planctomycetota bacterium]|nr:MAG: hypothetical protein JSV03_06485 [Planctomycetota bacterium]
MSNRCKLTFGSVILLITAALCGLIGHEVYFRSDYYRRGVESGLTEFFGLPVDVNKIAPSGISARKLSDVQIWLPQRRARIFQCPKAIWDTSGSEVQDGTIIHVHNADLSIGSQEWESGDYMRVLQASLAHNFQQLDIRQVRFHNTRITWPRKELTLSADGVEGNVLFDNNCNGGGHAELTSRSLNGVTVREPIRIQAILDPLDPEALIPEVTLTVPALSIGMLGLGQVLQSTITQGTFAGEITLRQSAQGDEIEATGFVKNIRLSEFTKLVPGGAVPAIIDFKIDQAHIRDQLLIKLAFSGRIRKLQVDALLHRFGLPKIHGTVELTVDHGLITKNTIQQFNASGQWVGGSLETLTGVLLDGVSLQGTLLVQVNSLVIENNKLIGGNIDLMATLPKGKTGKIERKVLIDLVNNQLGLTLPENLLPEVVEYVQLGAKLTIEGHKIRLTSAEGPVGPALITIRLSGLNVPLLGQIDKTFDVDRLLQQAGKRAKDKVRALKDSLTN